MRVLIQWLRDAWKGKYVCFLEAELERLQVDNRDLVNSLLTAQGMPTIGPRQARHSGRVAISRFAIPSQARRRNEAFDRALVTAKEKQDASRTIPTV